MGSKKKRSGRVKKPVSQSEALLLRELLERAKLTSNQTAEKLGLTDRMVRYYCAGAVRIPKVVWLALEAIGVYRPGIARA